MNRDDLVRDVREAAGVVDEALGPDAAVEIRAALAAGVFRVLASGTHSSSPARGVPVTGTVNELIGVMKPSSNPETVALFAYFLDASGKEDFGNGDLEDLYKKCKIRPPANLADVVSRTIRKGWIYESGGTAEGGGRTLRITATGQSYVQEQMTKPK